MLVRLSLPGRPAIKLAFVDTEVLDKKAFGIACFRVPVVDVLNDLITNIRFYPLLA